MNHYGLMDHYHMGLPASSEEAPLDCNAMRQAIEQGRYDSPLIQKAFMTAAALGLSGEDKYVMLAYHALLALETYFQRELKRIELEPMPPVVRPPR